MLTTGFITFLNIMKISKISLHKTIIAFAAILGAFTMTAQNSVNSPYSRFGYGILSDNVTSAQRGMGGVGIAMNSGRQINVMNPASYAAIDTLTFLFDIGANLRQTWSTENGTGTDGAPLKGSDTGGGLDYITMQFPLGKYMGGSAGILPYSEVGYSFGEAVTTPGGSTSGVSSRQGSGGINQVYIGVAGRPYKGLTVGANVAYLFGKILHDNYVTNTNASQALFERVLKVTDYKLDFGIQYSYKFNKKHRLTAGVTYSPSKSFHGHSYGVHYPLTTSTEIVPDTTGYTNLKGRFTMPDTWGAGINYEFNDRLMIEADVTYQPWSKAKYQPLSDYETNENFVDRWKFNAGMQFTTRLRGNYLQRIQYRGGVFACRDYLNIHGNTLREYGVSIGFGFPTANTMMLRSIVNLSVEYRRRQAHPTPLIKEDCLMITLGVNFNEMWFFQSKIH